MKVNTLPNDQEIALAKLSSQELSTVLATNGEVSDFNVVSENGETHCVKLSKNAVKLMIEVLTQLGNGNSVNITPIHAELTTQEAADLLNMSRPTFIKLLDSNDLPYSRTGNRRKVAFSDVINYKQTLEEKRLSTAFFASFLKLSECLTSDVSTINVPRPKTFRDLIDEVCRVLTMSLFTGTIRSMW